MAEVDAQMKLAVLAYKAGRRDEARDLLLHVVDRDEANEEAWLYLSALVETLEEQQICLENVLALNPHNERARKGLEEVRRRGIAPPSAAQSSAPHLAPPPATASGRPARAATRDEEPNPFGEESFEEWLSSAQSLYGAPPQPDTPIASASGASPLAAAPVPFGGDSHGAPAAASAFDEWAAELRADQAGPRPAARDALVQPPHDVEREIPGREADPTVHGDDPLEAEILAAFAEGTREQTSRHAFEVADPFVDQIAATVDPSGFVLDESVGTDEDDWLADVAAADSAPVLAAPPAQPVLARTTEADYYRYIPTEIEAGWYSSTRRVLLTLVAVLLLAALNAVSFAFLFSQL